MSNTATPGYNIRLAISFAADKAGRRYASYWSPAARRSIRISMASAELWVATGLADRA